MVTTMPKTIEILIKLMDIELTLLVANAQLSLVTGIEDDLEDHIVHEVAYKAFNAGWDYEKTLCEIAEDTPPYFCHIHIVISTMNDVVAQKISNMPDHIQNAFCSGRSDFRFGNEEDR